MPLPLLALFLAAFAVGTTELIIAGLLPALAFDLNVDIPTAGLLISGYAIGVAIGGPLLSLATTTLPRRPLLLVLMVVFVAGNVLCALSTSYWLLMGSRLVIAGSHGLFFGSAMIIATRLVPKERQASAVSLVVAGITLANVLGAPIGTAIGNAYGWRMSFWVISVVGVLATIGLALLIPRANGDEPPQASDLRAELRAVGRRKVWLSYVMIALTMTAFFAPFGYIVPILTDVTGIPIGIVPVLLFISGVGGILGNLIGGRLGDWKPMVSLLAIYATSLTLYVISLVAVYSPIAFGVVFFLWALVGFSFAAPVQARILQGASDAPNLASTLISTAFNIGIAAGAWLGGVALNAGWGYAQLPWISVLFLALTLAVAVFTWATERRRPA